MLTVKGVKRGFPVAGGDMFWALKGIDLHIEKGKLTILRGKSGSGKTTLMNILSALDYPTEGEVFFREENIVQMGEPERGLLRRQRSDLSFSQ